MFPAPVFAPRGPVPSLTASRRSACALTVLLVGLGGCASGAGGPSGPGAATDALARAAGETVPTPDPRVGLRPGLFDAGEAIWNLRMLSTTPPPQEFVGIMNSDLAFTGDYAIQGNFNGIQIWDIADPARPSLVKGYVCPASQSDVSVYGHLLFVSGEDVGARLDCGTQGVDEAVSPDRLRGIRIFDISDIRNPEYVANVQTCRGSHTHTLFEDPNDDENVYIYVSGSSFVRSPEELPGCASGLPEDNPNTALFRIEVIRVPLAAPERAEVVSSPRIFAGLVEAPTHGLAPDDEAELEAARERGAFVIEDPEAPAVLPDPVADNLLAQLVARRGGSGSPTAMDSTALREYLGQIVQQQAGADDGTPQPGPTQCHDITVYPEMGLAGGACEGYGLLIDMSDPVNPVRVAAVSDENFAYWHSATFNNDATQILFSDEWGGGMAPKCRPNDPREWGSDALFAVEGQAMRFQGYYKLPAPQTPLENCVAHNGSLIPVPGRDVMVQGWYQGGISVFDWSDPSRPVEIAFHDRGPVDGARLRDGGSWSVYWYNGLIVNSEIARGLDIFELTPSELLSQNEIAAANSVHLEYLNAQSQPRFVWPATFALAGAYLDQLERSRGLPDGRIRAVREALASAEGQSGAARRGTLQALAEELEGEADASADAAKVRLLVEVVRAL